MAMMESGSASLPSFSSLKRFLPDLQRTRTEGEENFPLDAAWAHHGANQYFGHYNSAVRRMFGEPTTVADFCWQGHVVSLDQHRAIYEAVNHRLWDITSGMTQWKISACEPSVQ